MLYRMLIISVLAVLVGCTIPPHRHQPTSEQLALLNQQSLESYLVRMNQFKGVGGWQEYSTLHLSIAGDEILFETAYGELKITVQSDSGEKTKYFLIPAVVHMNQGLPKPYQHEVDSLEVIGLHSQLYLFILEKAFPAGPKLIQGTETNTIRIQKIQVVYFLSGSMVLDASWEADVTVNRKSPHRIDFIITQNPKDPQAAEKPPINGIWSDQPRDEIIEDVTILEDWAVNYFPGATEILQDRSSIRRIGDIREDLRFFNKRRSVESVDQIVTQEDAEYLASGYYLSPKPELISQLIDFMGREGTFSKQKSIAPLLGFYSQIFSDNRARHTEWKAVIERQEVKTRELLMKALEQSPDQLTDNLQISPARNDMLWGIFFASGDKKVIQALTDQLEYLTDIDNPQRFSTAMTAKWSLAENARFHPTVKQLIVELRENGSPEMRQAAADILEQKPQTILDEYKATAKSQKAKGRW